MIASDVSTLGTKSFYHHQGLNMTSILQMFLEALPKKQNEFRGSTALRFCEV